MPVDALYSIVGAVLLGLGIAGWTWFIRNALRPSSNQALMFRRKRGQVVLGFLFLSIAGYGLARASQDGLVVALILGLAVGLWISQT